MIYVILAVQLALLGLIVTFIVRWFRTTPEKRADIRPTKKTVLFVVGTSVVGFLALGSMIVYFFGIIGIRVTSAAKDYLRTQYGPTSSWEISILEHIEYSKKPEAGIYRLHFRYGEKEGDLLAEYIRRDGKLEIDIPPLKKKEEPNKPSEPTATNPPASATTPAPLAHR